MKIDGATVEITNAPALRRKLLPRFKAPGDVAAIEGNDVVWTTPQALTFSPPLALAGGNVTMPKATSLVDGYLAAVDWTTFNAKESVLTFTSPLVRTANNIAPDMSLLWTWTANGIAATPTDRLQLSNTTAGTSSVSQDSPALRFSSNGWSTSGGGSSRSSDWRIYGAPSIGNPMLGPLVMDCSIAGAAFSRVFTLDQFGDLTLGGFVSIANTSSFNWASRSQISSPSNGVLTLMNNAASDFTRLQFGGTTSSFPALARSSATLKAVLADNSADCAFTALSFQSANPASGTAATWKFGSKGTATVALDTAHYCEIDIGGVAIKLAIVT